MAAILEHELVRKAQQGDRASFGRLVELHARSLMAITYSRVGNLATSEDLTQDAFLLAFENLGKLRRPGLFGPWLRTIARNLCHRWHRNRIYRDRLQDDAVALKERLGYTPEPGPVHALENRETSNLLQAALDRLPEHEREALLLFYFEGQSVNAAATAAGVSPAAMRKRLQRARESLRDLLTVELETSLTQAGRENRTRDRVLAAIPLGASFAKVAAPALVVPGAISLVVSSGLAIKAAAVAVVLVALAAAVSSFDLFRSEAPLPSTTTAEVPLGSSGNAHVPVADVASAASLSAAGTPLAATVTPPSVSGRVFDANGAPLPGARVEVRTKADEYEDDHVPRKLAAETVADANGDYTVGPLPAGEELALVASQSGWANGGAILPALGANEHREGLNVALVPAATASGIVVDVDGHPISDATVFVHMVRPADQQQATGSDVALGWEMDRFGDYARTQTGSDGRFTLLDVPDGRAGHHIGAFKEGYGLGYALSEESARRQDLEMGSGRGSGWSAFDIAIPTDGLRIVLPRPASISGRVVQAGTGVPVPEAVVRLDALIEYEALDARTSYQTAVRTDGSGAFRLDEVPPSNAYINAVAGDRVSFPVRLPLKAGQDAAGIDLAVDLAGTVEGTVYDAATGHPVPKARFSYYAGGGVGGANLSARADARGHFVLSDVPAGEWVLSPDPGWRLSRAHHSQGGMSGTLSILAEAGKTVVFDQYWENEDTPSAKVTGRVTDRGGRPVAGAEVQVELSFHHTETDEQGRYALEDMRPGPTLLKAFEESSMACGTALIDVQDGQPNTVDIALTGKAARIIGRLIDPQGKPVSIPIEIEIFSGPHAEQHGNGRRLKAVDGTYTTGPTLPDRYLVSPLTGAEGFRIEPPSRLVIVEEGQELTDVDFVLTPRTGFVAGAVVRDDRAPAAYVAVAVLGPGVEARGSTDAQGRFRVEGVEGEDLRLVVGEVRGSEWAEVTGVASGTEDVRVVLQPAGIITGYVTIEDREARRFGMQATNSAGETIFYGGEGGNARFNVLPGTYRLEFRCDTRRRVLEDVVVAPGEETDLGTVEVASGTCAVRGAVTRNGAPVVDIPMQVRIRLLDSTEELGADTFPRDGAYRADRLEPGRYRVELQVVGGSATGEDVFLRREVELSEGAERVVDFDLAAPQTSP